MALVNKLRRLLWFSRNPGFWRHGATLIWLRLTNAARHERLLPQATAWAAERACSAREALVHLGLFDRGGGALPAVSTRLMEQAERRARSAKVRMGGPADLELLHATVVLLRPRAVVETGVAYGWSSLIILAAMEDHGTGQLVSVDRPYPGRNNEQWVGMIVPEALRHRWRLFREADADGIDTAIAASGGAIDLCHYDSDKSYNGRMYAYPPLWGALRAGGVFISDDIQDNFGFRDFCSEHDIDFRITESGGKFVGIARK